MLLSCPLNAARPPLARFSLKAPSMDSLSWPRRSRSNECLPYTGGSQTEPGSSLHKLFMWDVVQRDHRKPVASTLAFAALGLLVGWKGEKSSFELLWETNQAFFFFISLKVSEEFLHLVFQLRGLSLPQLQTLWHEASFKCRNDWSVFFFGFVFNAALICCCFTLIVLGSSGSRSCIMR